VEEVVPIRGMSPRWTNYVPGLLESGTAASGFQIKLKEMEDEDLS